VLFAHIVARLQCGTKEPVQRNQSEVLSCFQLHAVQSTMAKMCPPKKTSYYLVCLNYPFVVWDKQSALEDLRNAQTRAKILGFELEGEFIPVYSTADSMTHI